MAASSVLKQRTWWQWVATGAIGAVVVSGAIYFPTSPALASTLLPVGDLPCVQQVTDTDAVTVTTITDDDTDEPTDCVVTFTSDTGWALPANVSELWVLGVGGGGAGSQFGGGGGGAVYENTEIDVADLIDPNAPSATVIDIVVGAGGTNGAGSLTRFGNIDAAGGQAGDANGAGGQSGAGQSGGQPATGPGNIIAGGGGGGAGGPGTNGLYDDGVAVIAPTTDSLDILDTGDSGNGNGGAENGDENPEPPPAEGEAGGNESEPEPSNDDNGEESTEPEPDPVVELRAGNGGVGVSTEITGTTVYFAGGGGAAFDADGTDPITGGGQNGQGGGSDAWGGGGAAGQSGGDGIVIIRYAIPEKDLPALAWDVPSSVAVGEESLALPEATTTSDGAVSYQVGVSSTSNCTLSVTDTVDGDDNPVTTLEVTFSEPGSCVLTVSTAETATFQAVTLTKTLQITSPPPVISQATPNQGPANGGTRVTITGSNLSGVTTVTFGGRAGVDLDLISDTELQVTTPTRQPGDFVTSNALIQLASLNAVSSQNVTFGFQGGTFMLDNGVIRFGGNSGNNANTADVTTNSIAPSGVPNQPYYRAADGRWFKLTFSDAPLSMTVATGEGASNNWTGSRIPEEGNFDTGRLGLIHLDNMVVTVDNWTTRRESGGIDVGYGRLTVSGTADINGRLFGIQHTMDLGANASFVRINTTLINLGENSVPGVHMWVGTRDDWVGTSDRPTKTRGNLTVADGFAAITANSQLANAIQITSGAEGVLFYSTTPGVNSVHASCCSFINSYNLNPTSAPITTTGDGSYAMYLPVGSLDANQSRDITWFYAAGSIQDLGNVASAVAAAALPPQPTVIRGDGEATIVWEAPDPGTGNTIVGYNYRYSTDGGVTWVEGPADLPPTPLTTTVTGLDNGVNYEFQIRAIIQEGQAPEPVLGQWSPTTQSAVLGAPQRPTLDSAVGGDGRVTLSFARPASLVDDITGYQYSLDNGTTWQTFVAVGDPVIFPVTGLANGQQFDVRIRAVNDLGPSEASDAIRVPTMPVITTAELGTLTRNQAANRSLQGQGGTLTWSVVAGSLPQGLGLNGATGVLTGSPTTAGPYDVTIAVTNATGQVTRQFVGVVVPFWPDNAIQFGGPATRPIQTVIDTSDALGLNLSGGAQIVVDGLPAGMTATITGNGEAGVFPTVTLSGTPTQPGLYPVDVVITAGGVSLTQVVTLVVTAAPPPPAAPRPRPQAAAVVEIAPPAPAPLRVPTTTPQNTFIPIPPVVSGPVLNNGRPPAPQTGLITIRRDNQSADATARVLGNSGLEIEAGQTTLGVRVNNGSGEIRALQNGAPEIVVERGAEAQIQGQGFLPFSTAQVFLPLAGNNAIELARVQVDERGALNGQARFLTGPGQAPIPIGPQVLQIVTVDGQGRQVSVDMTINVAQPPPAPEANRETGEIPTLTPGQFFATEAGLPVTIRVDVDPDNGSTSVTGGDWSMSIAVNGETSQQATTANGDVVVEIVRDSIAAVSGEGFMPQTRVDVWLFSTPTLIGTVVTDDDGAFAGFVSVDSRSIAPGTHTLQLQGVGTDGYVRAANLGVVVTDALTDQQPGIWAWWWWALGGGALGLVVWFLFGRRHDSDDDDLDDYDPSKRVYSWSVTENSPKRGSYRADLIGVSMVRHG